MRIVIEDGRVRQEEREALERAQRRRLREFAERQLVIRREAGS